MTIDRKHGLPPRQQRKTRAPMVAVNVPLRSVNRVEYPNRIEVPRRPLKPSTGKRARDLSVSQPGPPLPQQRATVRLRVFLAADRISILFGDDWSRTKPLLKFVQNQDLQRHIDGGYKRSIGLLHDRVRGQFAPRGDRQQRGLSHQLGNAFKLRGIGRSHRGSVTTPPRDAFGANVADMERPIASSGGYWCLNLAIRLAQRLQFAATSPDGGNAVSFARSNPPGGKEPNYV